MRRTGVLLLLLSFSTPIMAATTGRGGIFFGQKQLNHSDWGDLDTQPGWGVHLDVKDESWPVWATVGYFSSRDEITAITSVSPFATRDIVGQTSEIQVGVKKDFFPIHRVLFSVAGGPTYAHASLDAATAPYNNDSDSALGVWGGADLIFFFTYMSVGVAYQYSQANVDLFGRSVNAGGSSLAFSVGFGW